MREAEGRLTRRSAVTLGMLILSAAGAFLFQRCGEDVPEAGSSRRPADGATPPPPSRLAAGGSGGARSAAPVAGTVTVEVGGGGGAPRNTSARGTVVDEDGRPIPGATVIGQADVDGQIGPGAAVSADAVGRFEVPVVNDDVATLTVSAPGFVERTITRQTRETSGVVLRRENRSQVRIHLTGDVVEGDAFRVVRADADMSLSPADEASIILPPQTLQSWAHYLPTLPLVKGVLHLPDRLEPGVTRLLLLGQRGSAGPRWLVVPPQASTIDLEMEVRPRKRLEVRCTKDGLPVPGGYAILRAEGIGRPIAWAWDWIEGRATLEVLDVPGRWLSTSFVLECPVPDGAVEIDVAQQPVDDSDFESLDIDLVGRSDDPPVARLPGAPGTVNGRIGADAWPPLDSGFVRAIPWPIEPLPPEDPLVEDFSPRAGLGTSPRFSLSPLDPGRYLLVLRCGALVASTDGPVEVHPGEVTDVGTLPLLRGASLVGRVLDAEGGARPFTRVVVMAGDGEDRRSVWTDADGGYRVEGLWPGVFYARAGSRREPGFSRGEIRVSGSAEHRLDLRPAAPR